MIEVSEVLLLESSAADGTGQRTRGEKQRAHYGRLFAIVTAQVLSENAL